MNPIVLKLRRENQKLRDENAKLEYYGQLANRWASGHCAERMSDYERHLKELRGVLKMRRFDDKRFYAFIRREAKQLGKAKYQCRSPQPTSG